MVPEAARALLEPSQLAGLAHPIARTWVRLLQDAIVTVEMQDAYVATIGGADVVDVDAAHMAMISQPIALAQILDEIAVRALSPDGSTA